jgi:ComF family protein
MNILNFLFPSECISCQKLTYNSSLKDRYLCSQCQNKIGILQENQCIICKTKNSLGKTCKTCQNKTSLSGLIISTKYDNPILREVIHYFKYRYLKDLSVPLALLMKKRVQNFPNTFFKETVLIPIPLSKKRLKKRGFNQAYLIAHHLSNWLNIPLNSDIMKRVRSTSPQAEIKDYKTRQKNIKNNFRLNSAINSERLLRNKKVILIDDVTTTGATLEECAKVLKPYVKEVWGWTIAK